jgi:ABC-type transport system substrate-binding protein
MSIIYPTISADWNHEFIELQSEWKQIGLNVKLVALPSDSWFNHLYKPTTSLTYQGGDPWETFLAIDDYPDAEDFTTTLFGPTSAYNVGNYGNPTFDNLINEALTARGPERAQLYIKASRLALNDVALSMIGQQTITWRWSQNITGMTLWSGALFPMPANHDWTKVDVH